MADQSQPTPDPVAIELRLRVVPVAGWPWNQRFKQLLKTLGRAYRLRLEWLRVEDQPAPETKEETDADHN